MNEFAALTFAFQAISVPLLTFGFAYHSQANELNEIEQLPATEVTAFSGLEEASASSYDMPVTSLPFHPLLDVKGRNMGEAQADLSIRGGTFQSTGIGIGATPVYDPQTAHYLSELPISPDMLTEPVIRAGASQSMNGWNATAGSVAYGWKPIKEGGNVMLGTGRDSLFTSSFYSAFVGKPADNGGQLGFDISTAYSEGGDVLPLAGHQFQRYNGRLQWLDQDSQTDLFVGYQDKDFSWPNLYAARLPGGPLREEREHLRTQLYMLNHRHQINQFEDWVQVGAYYRVNKDHYSIPDFNYHARHRSKVGGFGLDGRFTVVPESDYGRGALRYRAGLIADDLRSTELVFGNYNSRSQYYAGAYWDQTLTLSDVSELTFTGGVNYDDSNRIGSAFSPVAGIVWQQKNTDMGLRQLRLDYSETTQVPSYTALNSSPAGLFGGDPDLGRARSRNVELGGDFQLASWNFSPSVFFRRDKGLVDWVFDPTQPALTRSAREVDLETWGVELLAGGAWRDVDFEFGYSWLQKTDDYTTSVVGSFYAMDYARHRFIARASAPIGEHLKVFCDHEVRLQNSNALRSSTRRPVFTSLGATLQIPGYEAFEIDARIDNLWGNAYETVPLVPGTPRTWAVGLRYQW